MAKLIVKRLQGVAVCLLVCTAIALMQGRANAATVCVSTAAELDSALL